jgi:hypothetical protein
MNAWLHLVKKEFRLGLSAFLTPIVTFLILTGIAAYLGYRYGFVWEAVVAASLFATGFQVFYLVYYMLNSLQTERKKLHLWIHSTMPGYGLLLAKLVAGFISMILTLFVTGTTLLIAINQSAAISEQLQMVNKASAGLVGGSHLLLFSLYFGVWIIFYWFIFMLLNRNLGTFLSFLATLAVFVAVTTIYNWFQDSVVYEALTNWGEIHISGITESISISTNLETGTEVLTEVGQLSFFIGSYVFETVIVILLFVVSCWMLDRKVEV